MRSQRSPEAYADELLKDIGETLPINVEQIARSVGAHVMHKSLEEDASGYLIRDRGNILIVIEKSEPLTRQRFTIAHELGHLCMHPGRPLVVEADVKINKRSNAPEFASELEERQANQFAAALLMPQDLVKNRFDKLFRRDANIVAVLARDFGVSQIAMEIRLTNLGLMIPK